MTQNSAFERELMDYEVWLDEAKDKTMAERDRKKIYACIGVDFMTMQPLYLNIDAFDESTIYENSESGKFIVKQLPQGRVVTTEIKYIGGKMPSPDWFI